MRARAELTDVFWLKAGRELQSQLFCWLAVTASLAVTLFQYRDSSRHIAIFFTIITVLGVPHGALDTLAAKNKFQLTTLKRWLQFGAIYLCLAALVVLVWYLQPAAALATFLIISVVHFSSDLETDTFWLTRWLYGGAIVVLPSLFHFVEVRFLFSLLIGTEAASPLADILKLVAPIWAFGLAVACLAQFLNRDRQSASSMFFVGLAAITLPPLLSFTIFFVSQHSPRHILQMVPDLPVSSLRAFLLMVSLPLLIVAALACFAYTSAAGISVDSKLARILFIGLSALTVPHMLLIDREV